MTKTLEIVTHCYCPPTLDAYARLLRFQFASLIHNPVASPVTLTVCYTSEDAKTAAEVRRIGSYLDEHNPAGITLRALDFPPGGLFRRAVGRNFAALQSAADVIWFTDVDYVFGPGCLQAVADMCDLTTELAQPAEIWISRDHATGDQDLWEARDQELPRINPEHFAKRRQKVCIGGVQIVGGHVARRVGYCSGTRWVDPVDPEQGFRSCRCDKVFRRLNGFVAQRLPIPNTYRLRHGRDGRDIDLKGATRGKEVW